VTAARPLIRLRYEYPELAVDLDTWLVTAWQGTPASNEHPQSAWVLPDDLPRWPLLAADQPIVRALRLPAHCVFTPPTIDQARFARQLDALPEGALVRLRWPGLSDAHYHAQVEHWSVDIQWERPLILDRDPAAAIAFGADGFHARADVLARLPARPVPAGKWFGASCHDAADLARARALDADYAVLGPVRPTATHAGAPGMGWEAFAQLATHAGLPVYAIGGVGPTDLETAWRHGAQGVAGISAYWRG
jgi:8-oxo-dGTP diphosphatase